MDDPTQNPAFRRWFGASQVVDAAGRPRIVYHGTDREFEIFVPQAGERGDGGIFIDTVHSPFKFFSADYNYAWGVADAKSIDRIVLRCYLRMEHPIDLRTAAGRVAFNTLFGTFERHSKVRMLRDRIGDLRIDLDRERRRVPKAQIVYDIYDGTRKIGASTRQRDDTPYRYVMRQITADQMAKYQARSMQKIERTIAGIEQQINRVVGRSKQPVSAWAPLDESDAATKVQAAGYDGLMFLENTGEVSYAIIEPTQVKAVKNRGQFDPTSPNIYEVSAGAPRDASPPSDHNGKNVRDRSGDSSRK